VKTLHTANGAASEVFESSEGYGEEESTNTVVSGGSWLDVCWHGGGEEIRDQHRGKGGGQYGKFSSSD
jgi:hypothetical protein